MRMQEMKNNSSFFKRLFCFHYYEDRPSVKFYEDFISFPSLLRVGMKTVICNKCGKVTHKPQKFIDIKRIDQ